MSEFRFRLPADWQLNSHYLNSIFVVGLDGIPWPCKVRVDSQSPQAMDGAIVHVARNRDESGHVFFLYPSPTRGELLLATGTLPVREETYDLLTELARGTLNRLRNQLSIWREGGLVIDESMLQKITKATGLLAASVMCQQKVEQDRTAAASIQLAIDAMFNLAVVFTEQIAPYRRQQSDVGAFWLANAAGHDNQLMRSVEHAAFELVQFNPFLNDASANRELEIIGKQLILGPWLDASAGGMTSTLLSLTDHLDRRERLLKDCRRLLEDLPNRTALIHLVSGLNGMGHRHLSYPQQLQLTIELLQLVDQSMVEMPVMVSFDFPWAERLANAVGGIHPLQIADSLLRQAVRISYFGLEINLDYWPNGSALRDPFQWIDLIDVWAQLDLPLVLCLRFPSGGIPDDSAESKERLVNRQYSNWTEQQRIEFLNVVLPMMVARPIVHGIIFQQWQDGDDTRFPHGGLVNREGQSKPIEAVIARLRQVIAG